MQYHIPVTQNVHEELPSFMIHANELVCPKNIYLKAQYPKLPCDMVKVLGINGQHIFIPLAKMKNVSEMDI